jgi:aspartokinase-like uncharacterized kinase
MRSLVIAKIGGSLFDLADLRERTGAWMADLGERPVLLIPGGGAAADVIRRLDQVHQLEESAAHWLALRMMAVNAHFLAGLFGIPVAHGPVDRAALRPGLVGVLDAFSFCQADELAPGSLPHSWDVTSDSIAARVAQVSSGSLVLLKSTEIGPARGWDDAAAAGLVDAAFAGVVSAARLPVSWVNLRSSRFDSRTVMT